jgi:hypothetical protein
LATGSLVAYIDADHRLDEGALGRLVADLEAFELDVVQSCISISPVSFWCRAESDFLDLTHNIPGRKKMVGVAPAIFGKVVLETVRFEDRITKTIDDTDFMYRLDRDYSYVVGIGTTTVVQDHAGSLTSYVRKFRWYGRGDAEFCIKHPERQPSMLFHLGIRYPFVYSAKALVHGRWRVAPYAILQGSGLTRVWLTG